MTTREQNNCFTLRVVKDKEEGYASLEDNENDYVGIKEEAED